MEEARDTPQAYEFDRCAGKGGVKLADGRYLAEHGVYAEEEVAVVEEGGDEGRKIADVAVSEE
jgi:hypothetical protein